MPAEIIDGRACAAAVREDITRRAAALPSPPGLATILVGEDPASAVYVAAKRKACSEVGIESFHHALPGDTSQQALADVIEALNDDARVSGILCQLPLPGHLDADAVVNRITPEKDVDGLTVVNAGRLAAGVDGLRPCTPSGVMDLLTASGRRLAGADAVVIGRSNLFGKPMAQMLLAADATVTVCHSKTADIAAKCRAADVVIAAVGRPRLVQADWIRPGATVIDVGINRQHDGLVGDVDFAAVSAVAKDITPVPGGVGPMTIACLLRNTVLAAERALASQIASAA